MRLLPCLVTCLAKYYLGSDISKNWDPVQSSPFCRRLGQSVRRGIGARRPKTLLCSARRFYPKPSDCESRRAFSKEAREDPPRAPRGVEEGPQPRSTLPSPLRHAKAGRGGGGGALKKKRFRCPLLVKFLSSKLQAPCVVPIQSASVVAASALGCPRAPVSPNSRSVSSTCPEVLFAAPFASTTVESTQRPPAHSSQLTRNPHLQRGGAWFACCVVQVSQSVGQE